jgi:hypothetical protein
MFNFFNSEKSNKASVQNSSDSFNTLQKARQDLIDEINAIIEYDNHIHSSTDKLARETWEDIKHEELVHVGELLGLIGYLDPTQQTYVQNGLSEFNDRLQSN